MSRTSLDEVRIVTTMDDPQRQAEQALIEEARRHRRRRIRWIQASASIALLIAATAYVVLARDNSPSKSPPISSRKQSSATAANGKLVTPEHPYLMTVSASETLFVVDVGRDQILRRLASGKFESVVGDGKRGFAGDGGLAVKAHIDITSNSGVVTDNGILYFSDTRNNRVREVLPDGIIKTVVGGGAEKLGVTSAPARSVELSGPAGLAFGPNGSLYIATTSGIYRLGPDETLHWVVGKYETPPRSWKGVWSSPAIQLDFTQPLQIAFDAQGNLFDGGGGGGWGLYERVRNGQLKFLGVDRGDGSAPTLAEASNGSVLMASRFGLFSISPLGKLRPTNVSADSLNNALGHTKGVDHENVFIGGDGIAVTNTGSIYVDTNAGNDFTSVSAILEVSPSGRVKTLWRS